MRMISRVKTPARALAKRIPALRKILRKLMYCYRRGGYILHGIRASTDEKLIVLESFSGKSYSDTPKAVYEYMLKEEKYNEYRFVWIFKEPEKYEALLGNPRTKLVKYRSAACERALAEAKYWIFNYRALDYWIPRKDQVYVQCWHGTPLKRLGYDIANSDNAMNSTDEIRDKYYRDAKRFKYLLSPCAFATRVFKTAWNLKALGKEDAILEVGYPRNDFLVNHTEKDVQEIKKRLGFENSTKKMILYAPTWRDNQHSASKGYTYKTEIDFEKLKAELGDEYVILFRAHYLVANSFDFERYGGFVRDVSGVDDINELYLISDMLITDYSSVFFDYAILERPIIFYMYDLEKYRDEIRGFYLRLEELPGEVITEEYELIKAIRKCDAVRNAGILRKFNEKFNDLNNGKATGRLVERILQGVNK